MAIKTTNSKCRKFVENQIPFEANNLRRIVENGFYVVLSYNWYRILAFDLSKKIWYGNKDKYSVSTSKQKSQANPYTEIQELTRNEIDNLVLLGQSLK